MNFLKKLTQITVIILTLCIGFSFADLVAEYKFEDDGTGYFGTDASDNDNHATIAGGVAFPDGEIQGKALQYDPSMPWQTKGNYFAAPDDPDFDLNTMTLEAWVKPVAHPPCPYVMNIIAKWSALQTIGEQRSYVFNIWSTGGKLSPHFLISPDGEHTGTTKELISVTNLNIGEWYHLVATFDGTTMRIYINGVEDCHRDEPGLVPHVGLDSLRVGIDGDGRCPMRGLIDNARIYNVALSAEEVANASVRPPYADAGEDQAVITIGSLVELGLDGGSWDPNDNPLTFLWEITQKPDLSEAVLSDATSETPTFTADKNGSYTIELVVSNGWASSLADEVVVSFNNIKPVAAITGENLCRVNETVSLSGSGSDANGDELTCEWQIVSQPEGSLPAMDAIFCEASFTPDAPGEYVIHLTVNDGILDSDPEPITITVLISAEDATTETLQDATYEITELPTDVFKNKKLVKTTTNQINSVLLKIDEGDIEGAYNQLKNAILKKTDGCAEGEAPDKNDWIKDCESQEAVYQTLLDALDLLFGLLP